MASRVNELAGAKRGESVSTPVTKETSIDWSARGEGEKAEPGEGGAVLGVVAAAGGVLGAIVTSACCVLPLAFVSVGITGAWMGNLTALAPYRPITIALTLALLAAGFAIAYRKPKAVDCEDGAYCASTTTRRITKMVLWVGAGLFLLGLGFPYALTLVT